MLGEAPSGLVHQFTVVTFERFYKDTLKTAGKCPECCLLSRHQRCLDPVCVFPTMQQLEQDKGLV